MEKHCQLLLNIFNENKYYVHKFVFCCALNTIVLILNFYATNVILNGQYLHYGYNFDSWCSVFPTLVSCTMPKTAFNGRVTTSNGICLLSYNMLNQRLYLLLWYLYVAIGVLSLIDICLKCALFSSVQARKYFLQSLMFRKSHKACALSLIHI